MVGKLVGKTSLLLCLSSLFYILSLFFQISTKHHFSRLLLMSCPSRERWSSREFLKRNFCVYHIIYNHQQHCSTSTTLLHINNIAPHQQYCSTSTIFPASNINPLLCLLNVCYLLFYPLYLYPLYACYVNYVNIY